MSTAEEVLERAVTTKRRKEALTKVFAGMVKQRWVPSKGVRDFGGEDCLYRGSEGRCCVVGFLIDDAVFEQEGLEDAGNARDIFRNITSGGLLHLTDMVEADLDFWNALQVWHDTKLRHR